MYARTNKREQKVDKRCATVESGFLPFVSPIPLNPILSWSGLSKYSSLKAFWVKVQSRGDVISAPIVLRKKKPICVVGPSLAFSISPAVPQKNTVMEVREWHIHMQYEKSIRLSNHRSFCLDCIFRVNAYTRRELARMQSIYFDRPVNVMESSTFPEIIFCFSDVVCNKLTHEYTRSIQSMVIDKMTKCNNRPRIYVVRFGHNFFFDGIGRGYAIWSSSVDGDIPVYHGLLH